MGRALEPGSPPQRTWDGSGFPAPNYEITNWYLSNHPESHFVRGLTVARPDPDRLFTLQGTKLSECPLDGVGETTK